MSALQRLLLILPLAACTRPEPAPVVRELAPAHALLARDGGVTLAGERFDLDDPAASAALGARLRAAASGLPEEAPTLVLACERGTPFARVERLMAVLEGAGIEDYRLDLGR